MAQEGITAYCHVYTAVTFDANANPSPSGQFLNLKVKRFNPRSQSKSENTTTIRGPVQGRGETGTFTTDAGQVSLEGNFPTDTYEGDVPVIKRRSVVYIDYVNGAAYFQGAVRVENVEVDNPAEGVVSYKIDGPTQGNYQMFGNFAGG